VDMRGWHRGDEAS